VTHRAFAHQIFPETFNARQLDLVSRGRASLRLDTSPSSGAELDERWRGRGLEGWAPEAVLSLIDRARHRSQTVPRPSSSTRHLWGSTSRHRVGLLARAVAGLGQKLEGSYVLRYAAVRGAPPSRSSTPRPPATPCRPPTPPPVSPTPASPATHRSHRVLQSFPCVLFPRPPRPAASACTDAARSRRAQSSHSTSGSASPAGWLPPASRTAREA